jgi:hypothetical protein
MLQRFTSYLSFRLILTLFVLLASISSIVVPPFETPDEIWHFAYIQQLATGGGLPVSEPNTKALWRQQGVQTPLYYLAAAGLTFWIDQSDFPALYERRNPYAAIGGGSDPLNKSYFLHYPEDGFPWQGSFLALHIARFLSVFLSAISLWAVYQTLLLLLDERQALLGVTLFAFIPQFVFISGAASNDNAVNAMTALLMWRLVLLLVTNRQRTKEFILIGLLLGLALLAKISATWLVLLTFGTLGVIAYRVKSWRTLTQNGLLVGGVTLAVSGWWFIRNVWLYGDPIASNIWLSNILLRKHPATWRTFYYSEWESLEHSFWGLFGWFNVTYPTWLYRCFQFLEVMLLLGLLLWAFRKLRKKLFYKDSYQLPVTSHQLPIPNPQSAITNPQSGVALLLIWLLCLMVAWWAFFRIAPAAQGRYFFPAGATWGWLMAVGWGALGGIEGGRGRPLAGAHSPTRPLAEPRPIFAWGIAFFLFVLSLLTPWWIIRPAYQPSTPLSSLPEGAVSLNITFEDFMRLEGYTVTPNQLAPSTAMDLTLYWRALRPIDEPLSISVKGFGRTYNDKPIAWDDSYPDGGRWATTIWQPEQLIVDRWRIWMSGRTFTPTLARLTVDVYRLDGENGALGAMLPATIEGEPVTLPFNFANLVVRSSEATPAATPSTEFALRVTDPMALKGYQGNHLAGADKGTALSAHKKVGASLLKLSRDSVKVPFVWEVGQALAANTDVSYQAFFHLTADPSQPPLAQGDFEPLDGTFPTPYWWAGDKLLDSAQLTLPSDAPQGKYQLLLGLYDLSNGQRFIGAEGQSTWQVGELYWDGEKGQQR